MKKNVEAGVDAQQEIKNIIIDFENEGKCYRYDFDLLTVEQAELAREVGEWKYNQIQSTPDTVNKVIDSRGAETTSLIMGYLLREVKNNTILPYDRISAETDITKFVKNMPVKQLSNLRQCIEHFFTNTKSDLLLSAILHGKKTMNAIDMLLAMTKIPGGK